ncbi:MAG: hypothetical protein R2787_06050 [Saprospiraceae bacterium]
MLRLLILSILFFLARWTLAQDTIPVYQEPFHHLVFANDEIRILDVRLQPGDTSAWHVHRDAITYIGLEGSRIWLDVPGEHPRSVYLPDDFWGGDTDYPEAPFVHRIANVGLQPFHLLAVEHLQTRTNPSGTDTFLDGWEVLDINPYFIIQRTTLDALSTREDLLQGHALLICRGEGDMLIQWPEGTVALDHGNWITWPSAAQVFTFTNQSPSPMELILLTY